MNLYIITGTTQGLGEALAGEVARDPANRLIALARAPDGPIPGGERIEVDLADRAALERAFDRVEQRLASEPFEKAVLINNAGVVSPVGPLDKVDGAALERNLAVNLVAPMLLMRRFIAATEGAAGIVRIINISSGAGRRPVSGWSAYCASKAGLDMATRVVALEAEARGRRVHAVSLAPGVIDTAMQGTVRGTSQQDFADVERFRAMKAQGVLRPAREVAAEILRLESEGRLEADAVQDLRQLA
jgi:benzil reductase ((S)-benzoin forming)